MVGNLYYAGTKSFGSLLIATLGFKCADIRILLGSRAHADQMEGDALVKELTGATVMAMAEDVPALNNMK